MTDQSRHFHLRCAGQPRIAMLDNREHLVVPVIALMEGVIRAVNADEPEFVPAEVLAAAAHTFNGRPLVVRHPTKDGKQISANDPGVMERQGFGRIFGASAAGGKMPLEAWVDPTRLEALNEHALLADIRAGKPIEVSVGGFVQTKASVGNYKGKDYKARWATLIGDHLAFLPGQRGACSIEMGCGAHRSAGEAAVVYEIEGEELKALSNPEGHNQYTGGGGGSDDKSTTIEKNGRHGEVKPASDGGHELHVTNANGGKIGSAKFASKKEATAHFGKMASEDPHAVGEFMMHPTWKDHNGKKGQMASEGKGTRSLRDRLKALAATLRASGSIFDTPEEAASEEAAELIGYKAIQSHLDTMGRNWDDANGIVEDLIADEEETPTKTPAQEAAEEEVETARLDALNSLLSSMVSSAYAAQQLVFGLNRDDLPQPSDPRYAEELRAAIGKTISAKNMKTIQAAHDSAHEMHAHTVGLGAECNGMKLLSEGSAGDTTGGDPAKETNMNKEAMIKALTACPCSGFKAGDEKALEQFSDERLTELTAASEANKATKDALLTTKAELKAASEKPAVVTEEQLLAQFPAIKALVDDAKSRDEAVRTDLVTKLVAACENVYTEAQLKALATPELERLAKLTKIDVPVGDYSIARPRAAAAADNDVYANPPNGYALALKQNSGKAAN